MSISGYRELSAQLKAMKAATSGRAMRSAVTAAAKPALDAARAAAPQANPPYGPYATRTTPIDPYPKKTYKGRLVTPGFASRSVASRSRISRDGQAARVEIGVRAEAFYSIQFLELGTSKIPKRPWLEPAFRGSRSAIDARLTGDLRRAIDRAVKREARAVKARS